MKERQQRGTLLFYPLYNFLVHFLFAENECICSPDDSVCGVAQHTSSNRHTDNIWSSIVEVSHFLGWLGFSNMSNHD
jgi:hypothetical protein